jgi:serine/threonine-protein kinase
MSPEQITGEKRPDASTDLYALGIILFRALTGELPFPGPDFLTQHLDRQPPRPSTVRPELGDGFDELVLALLKKQTTDRPRSAEEVRAWVERLAWPAEDGGGFGALEPSPEEKRPSSAPPPAGDEERYREVRALPGGAILAHDEIVDRAVVLEACDAARADRLRALARGDGPHLQAVFDVTERRAVLEQPSGVPLPEATLSPSAGQRVIEQVLAALERLHAAGIAHGAVVPERILVGAGRAVLLLPDGDGREASVDADRLAVQQLRPG